VSVLQNVRFPLCCKGFPRVADGCLLMVAVTLLGERRPSQGGAGALANGARIVVAKNPLDEMLVTRAD